MRSEVTATDTPPNPGEYEEIGKKIKGVSVAFIIAITKPRVTMTLNCAFTIQMVDCVMEQFVPLSLIAQVILFMHAACCPG